LLGSCSFIVRYAPSCACSRGIETGSGLREIASTTVSDLRKSSTRSRGTDTVSVPPVTVARRS
jgi:hypothetical protein